MWIIIRHAIRSILSWVCFGHSHSLPLHKLQPAVRRDTSYNNDLDLIPSTDYYYWGVTWISRVFSPFMHWKSSRWVSPKAFPLTSIFHSILNSFWYLYGGVNKPLTKPNSKASESHSKIKLNASRREAPWTEISVFTRKPVHLKSYRAVLLLHPCLFISDQQSAAAPCSHRASWPAAALLEEPTSNLWRSEICNTRRI